MATLLQGKIYWVSNDFKFTGHTTVPKDTTATVAKMENVLVEENMIRFNTSYQDMKNEVWNYTIEMINVHGSLYAGTFSEDSDRDNINGLASCELFENRKGYFLYGTWQDEHTYTWWAFVPKAETPIEG